MVTTQRRCSKLSLACSPVRADLHGVVQASLWEGWDCCPQLPHLPLAASAWDMSCVELDGEPLPVAGSLGGRHVAGTCSMLL